MGVLCQSAEAHIAVLLVPPPHLSNPLWIPAKQWISSHYVPNTQPLAGPFPRWFTNLTAYHSTSLLTVETFLEIFQSMAQIT